MYSDRLQFRKEHEVQGTRSEFLDGDNIVFLIVANDTCKQFILMNIKEDYEKCMEGGLFLEHEKLRPSVLIEMLSNVPKIFKH